MLVKPRETKRIFIIGRIYNMKREYNLSKFRSRKNPYVKFLKRQITIRINNDAIGYFRKMADDTGIPYQNLIDSYLIDCAENKRKLVAKWK